MELGYGEDRTYLLRLALQERWEKKTPFDGQWHFAGYWDFSFAVWDNRDASTADLGVTPVIRFERDAGYVEAAIGAHLVQRRISRDRIFSTAFQFGDHIGLGMRGRDIDVGVAFQHLSNASIRRPNPGINFVIVRLQYHLR